MKKTGLTQNALYCVKDFLKNPHLQEVNSGIFRKSLPCLERFASVLCAVLILLLLPLLTACTGKDSAGGFGNFLSSFSSPGNDVAGEDFVAVENFEVATTNAPVNQVYYFDTNRVQVRAEDRPSLDAQAKFLVKNPGVKIRIEGNTDSKGSRDYNLALAERRAKSISDVLKQNGVSPRQITVVTFGEEKPSALGYSESAYKLNRRVHLIYENLS